MNEREALFRTIVESPEDDVPRLVFADWLEEHGEEDRAEFIRLQCAIARRLSAEGTVRDDEAFCVMWDRQSELLRTHRHRWVRELPEWVEAQFFRRGFVAGVRVAAERWLDTGDELLAMTPVEQVAFTDSPRHFGRLMRDEGLQQLSLMSFASNGLSVQHMVALTRTQVCPNLRGLSLSGNLFGASAANVLASSPLAVRLEHLDFSHNPIGDDGLYVLARSPKLANLRTLQLLGTRVGDAAVHAVMDSPYLKRLNWFRVGEGISPATRLLLESRFPGSTLF